MTEINVLLADSNRQHQDRLAMMLTKGRPHVHVVIASSAAQALDHLQIQKFDCIVMDYHLSDTQAPQLLESARTILQDCPAVIISSSRNQNIVVSSMRHEGIDFVPMEEALKPEKLWARVAAAIGRTTHRRRENRQSERRIRSLSQQAHTDPLTGLQNRRHLEESLLEGRWSRDRRKLLACAMLDVDDFKHVNDDHGHAAGDAVLQAIAQVIRHHAGPGALAIRWGGEEFLIIQHVRTSTAAWLWADQIRRQIANAQVREQVPSLSVTATIGLVTSPTISFTAATIDHADDALRLGKSLGRDTVCTGLMSCAERAVDEHCQAQASGPDPKTGRLKLLECLEPHLGPVQKEYLTNHCQSVAHIASRLAENLALDDESVHSITMAGLFHDIGKCVAPEDLLAKPARLTYQEWDILNRSGRHGARLAGRLGLGGATVDLVDRPWRERQRNHSEPGKHDDRTGDAESTNELGVKVIRVADAFASMKTAKPWAAQRSHKQIIREMKVNRDGLFDPVVVEALDEDLAVAA